MIPLSFNFLAILVAAVAAFVLGFVWHGPLFGKQWMKMMNIPQSEIDAMKARGMGCMVPQMIASFFQQCVTALVIAHLTAALSITDALEAVMFAVLIWLGFIATIHLNTVLWEKRKLDLYFFNITYHLVSLIVMTLIVVAWK
jgi:hypothetical protein